LGVQQHELVGLNAKRTRHPGKRARQTIIPVSNITAGVRIVTRWPIPCESSGIRGSWDVRATSLYLTNAIVIRTTATELTIVRNRFSPSLSDSSLSRTTSLLSNAAVSAPVAELQSPEATEQLGECLLHLIGRHRHPRLQ
jgi:hypothetical protein